MSFRFDVLYNTNSLLSLLFGRSESMVAIGVPRCNVFSNVHLAYISENFRLKNVK